MSYSFRVKAGIALLVLFGFVSIHSDLKSLFRFSLTRSDSIYRTVEQIECLRDALPASGVVGLVFDSSGSVDLATTERVQSFHLTLYALAPLIVEPGFDTRWIVGILEDPSTSGRIATSFGLTLVKDCGNGIVAFVRSSHR